MIKRKSKYTKELLEENVNKVSSLSDLVRILTEKDKVHGSMTQYIKKKLIEYEIDFSHFKGAQGRRKTVSCNSLEYIKENYLTNPSKLIVGSHQLKKWLIKFKVLEEKCRECGIDSYWNGKYLYDGA